MSDDYGQYKGETPVKGVTRVLVWQQHRCLLAPIFKSSPHVFLASHVAGDVDILRDMGVSSDRIWAVEKDREQWQRLLERREREGWQLFPQKIEVVILRHPNAGIRSVYLDYCGNLEGTARPTHKVVGRLPTGSVVSVTLFLGREQHALPEDRETALLEHIRKATQHPVTLVQSILYISSSEDRHGSPMGTWTFFIGAMAKRPVMRFDLRKHTPAEIESLATPGATVDLWHEVESGVSALKKGVENMSKLSKAQRSEIALKAVRTRQLRERARKAVVTRRANAAARAAALTKGKRKAA